MTRFPRKQMVGFVLLLALAGGWWWMTREPAIGRGHQAGTKRPLPAATGSRGSPSLTITPADGLPSGQLVLPPLSAHPTEKEIEDRILAILNQPQANRTQAALHLLRIARDGGVLMEQREESFAHALNLMEEEDLLQLLPMAQSPDTPPVLLEGILGAARNHPIHREGLQLGLEVLKNSSLPDPSSAQEFVAFLLDVDAESPRDALISEASRILSVWPEGVDDIADVIKQFPQEQASGNPVPAPVPPAAPTSAGNPSP